MTKKRNKTIDWERIANDYASGQMSVRATARRYGVTETAIRNKAKKSGWIRAKSPAAPVRKTAIDWEGIEKDFVAGRMSGREIARWYGVYEAMIRKMAKQANWVRSRTPGHVVREPIVERLTVPAVAPTDLDDKARALAGRMMDELDAVTSLHGELEDMICAEESDPRRRQALLKSLSLSERAKTLKDISQTLKALSDAAAPEGKKAQRQANAERSASGGRFAAPVGPKLAIDNTR
jgi:hypothetical protein